MSSLNKPNKVSGNGDNGGNGGPSNTKKVAGNGGNGGNTGNGGPSNTPKRVSGRDEPPKVAPPNARPSSATAAVVNKTEDRTKFKWPSTLMFKIDNGQIPVYTEDNRLLPKQAGKDATGKAITKYTQMVEKDLTEWPAFKKWFKTFKASLARQNRSPSPDSTSTTSKRAQINAITIENVTLFGPRIGFIKMHVDATDRAGDPYLGAVFLRGASVAMLVVLFPEDQKSAGDVYTLLVRQPRLAIGSCDFAEIPAGMMDGSNSFAGTAATELRQELGFTIEADNPKHRIMDLTAELKRAEEARRKREGGRDFEDLEAGVFPSVGGCDEMITYMAFEKQVTREELKEWQGKNTGCLEEGEKIKVEVVPLSSLMEIAWRDSKAVTAFALYNRAKDLEKTQEAPKKKAGSPAPSARKPEAPKK